MIQTTKIDYQNVVAPTTCFIEAQPYLPSGSRTGDCSCRQFGCRNSTHFYENERHFLREHYINIFLI